MPEALAAELDEQQLRTVGALLLEEHGREVGSDRVPRTLAPRPSRAPAAGRPGRSLAGAEPLSGRTRVGRQNAARMRSPMPRSLSSGSIGMAVASSRRMRAPARAQPRSRRGRGPCPLRPARRAMQAALSPMAGRELRTARKGAVAKVTSSAAQTLIGDQRIAQDDRIEVRRTFRPQRWFSGLNSRESPANVGNREWPVANRGSLNTLQIGTIRAIWSPESHPGGRRFESG
jgi:hypothetical protein